MPKVYMSSLNSAIVHEEKGEATFAAWENMFVRM
jgi:hypothetical protein